MRKEVRRFEYNLLALPVLMKAATYWELSP
jgi:hypothetical protein